MSGVRYRLQLDGTPIPNPLPTGNHLLLVRDLEARSTRREDSAGNITVRQHVVTHLIPIDSESPELVHYAGWFDIGDQDMARVGVVTMARVGAKAFFDAIHIDPLMASVDRWSMLARGRIVRAQSRRVEFKGKGPPRGGTRTVFTAAEPINLAEYLERRALQVQNPHTAGELLTLAGRYIREGGSDADLVTQLLSIPGFNANT